MIKRRALLIYPEFPPSFWSFKYALNFLGKKSAMPPLGLLTIAGMFPDNWELKLIDLNVEPLTEDHLRWCDAVFTSTMHVQKKSLDEVIAKCNHAKIPVIAGGPHPTLFYDKIQGVSHFVIGEAEDIFPGFLNDFENGVAKRFYRANGVPDVRKTVLPRYDLIDLSKYGSMASQFARGCPFDCDFCDITKLYGRVPRTKNNQQLLDEFTLLYELGWRGPLFLVDDNFIGNKRMALELLPDIERWQKERGFPFNLYTEASVDLGKFPKLMDGMANAGFYMVFLGIETPNGDALITTNKPQNTSRSAKAEDYLLETVQTIQGYGLQVTGGFIIGLENDQGFDSHIEFIQKAGIPIAMAGLLTAMRGTNLYNQLKEEGRLLSDSSGNNTEIALNFIHKLLPREYLISEYKRVIGTLYQPNLSNYFKRSLVLLTRLGKPRISQQKNHRLTIPMLYLLAWNILKLTFSRIGPTGFMFLLKAFIKCPERIIDAVTLIIKGYHLQKITNAEIAVDNFRTTLEIESKKFQDKIKQMGQLGDAELAKARSLALKLTNKIRKKSEQLDKDFHDKVTSALEEFHLKISSFLDAFETKPSDYC